MYQRFIMIVFLLCLSLVLCSACMQWRKIDEFAPGSLRSLKERGMLPNASEFKPD